MVGNKKEIQRYLIDLPDDDKRYELKEYKRKRSLTANNYFHALVGKISEAITPRLSRTEVHNWLISDYGQPDTDLGAIILRDDIDWRKLDNMHLRPTASKKEMENGKLYRVYYVMRGSHTYNTLEMSKLLDGTIQEAQALDIDTVTVSERDRLIEAWGRQYERKHNPKQSGNESVLHMFGVEPDGQASLFVGNG